MTNVDSENLPPDWSRYRAYLRVLANAGVESKLQSKLDPSDLVQQTLLQAYRALASFRGTTEGERLAWLRQILVRNVTKAARDYSRERRDVNRERAIEAAVSFSSMRLEKILPIEEADPESDVIKAENILKLCDAVQGLPDGQRDAIELHHWQGMTISQVADQMDRTPAAVAGLLKRGLKSLRSLMREN